MCGCFFPGRGGRNQRVTSDQPGVSRENPARYLAQRDTWSAAIAIAMAEDLNVANCNTPAAGVLVVSTSIFWPICRTE